MTTECPTDNEIYIANALRLGISTKAIAKALKIGEGEVKEMQQAFKVKCEAIAKYYCGRVET